jgi:hypothetical protein
MQVQRLELKIKRGCMEKALAMQKKDVGFPCQIG